MAAGRWRRRARRARPDPVRTERDRDPAGDHHPPPRRAHGPHLRRGNDAGAVPGRPDGGRHHRAHQHLDLLRQVHPVRAAGDVGAVVGRVHRQGAHLRQAAPRPPRVLGSLRTLAGWRSEPARSRCLVQGQQRTAPVQPDGRSRRRPDQAAVRRASERVIYLEIEHLERYVILLSTTVTVSPFLGLLGTVWGIMASFWSMASMHSANLTVVAPGIAEALITTVAGLGAAIPAVIFYNMLVRKIDLVANELDRLRTILEEAASGDDATSREAARRPERHERETI
ncbi:MAG: MotA/TolQ/ExbB proton channel family protein [bacterium]|nr:MotA/TolQ/ExbB proton channel family protein [bacterium]